MSSSASFVEDISADETVFSAQTIATIMVRFGETSLKLTQDDLAAVQDSHVWQMVHDPRDGSVTFKVAPKPDDRQGVLA